MSAMDTAIYWIEYVIRNGNEPLRSPMMDMTWWQISLLDVYAVTLLGLIISIYAVKFIIKKLCGLLIFNNKSKVYTKRKRE